MTNHRHTLFIAPTGRGAGLTSVSLGLVRALDRMGLRVHFLKPIAQPIDDEEGPERSTYFIRHTTSLIPPDPIPLEQAQLLLSEGDQDQLMEEIVARYQEVAKDADVVVVEGMVPTAQQTYADQLNGVIARTLDAEVILVTAAAPPSVLESRLELAAQPFGGIHDPQVLGCIINKANMPEEVSVEVGSKSPVSIGDRMQPPPRRRVGVDECQNLLEECRIFRGNDFRLLGCIPWQQNLQAPRTLDVANYLRARTLFEGEIDQRRIMQIAICARTAPNMSNGLRAGVLIVVPGDRDDIVLATSMATLNGVPLAGLLLTSGIEPDPRITRLCERAFQMGLPVLVVDDDTYQTTSRLQRFNPEVPLDDLERVEWVMNHVARHIDTEWLRYLLRSGRELRLSPAAFRYQLTQRARTAQKRIILPEGDEPRTVRAAAFCQERTIAQCVLVGNPEEIHRVAEAQGVTLPDSIEIIDPNKVRHRYIGPMVALRKHKGLTEPMAEQQLEDNVVLATMMLAMDEVDGLVSGAVHTTANTIRPALQLIKTSPAARIVSSVFFMLLPEQVLVYGDCAVNPEPTAEELADIAIQSADSAAAFGINPKVAMISYSTGSSGGGSEVEKVRTATALAQKRRPDLLIDGPLQYDAAAIQSVAAQKAPGSPVAGQATVFIFPDLNTGNTTYKAVQRSANVISIGPMLQGLRKPVNDLSRGALVEDIIYTIAITAVQAEQAAHVLNEQG